MKWFFYVEMCLKRAVICGMVAVLLCFLLQATQRSVLAAEAVHAANFHGKGLITAQLVNSADVQNERGGDKFGKGSDTQLAMNQIVPGEVVADADEDIGAVLTSNDFAGESANLVVAHVVPSVSSPEMLPPTPPPDQPTQSVKENVLLAAAPIPTPQSSGKTKPAPGPKTSKSSSISTPVIVAAGVALAVGVAVAAGGGSGSDSSSDTAADSAPTSSGSTDVINLADLVRIGDDTDYNAHHPDQFKVSRPSGTSWTDSFTLNNFNTVTSATFKYTVAASKVGNPIYINGRQAGRLCNPGNTARNIRDCSATITGYIQSGSNQITIRCAIDPSDTVTPLDDVELYNLRIELTR